MKRIVLTLNQVSDFALVAEFETYLRQVGGALQSGDKLIIQTHHQNEEWKPGRYLYKYIKAGLIQSVELLENVNHYIELPLSFVQTESTDEENNPIIIERSDLQFIKNDTNCLVRITDESFSELYSLIANDLSNLFCNDKYLTKLYGATI